MRCGFVILHYLTADDTIECVKSIEEKCGDESEIVIVDNFSNDGSIEKVEKTLKYKNIHILKNGSNLGYARGNNVGYKYCREVLKLNMIAVSNNDIVVESNDLVDRVVADIKKYDAAVIGPDIKSLADGGHQNPMSTEALSYNGAKKELMRYRMLYVLEKIRLYDFIKKRFSRGKSDNIEISKGGEGRPEVDIQLHGAFLIFTKRFIDKMELAFDERTFLYMEEVILKMNCDRKGLVMLYDPSINVLHKEDSSTDKLNVSTHNKRLFVFKNMIKSLKVLADYIEKRRR